MPVPLRRSTVALLFLTLAVPAASAGATTADREPLDVRVFAEVPSPGQPEGIVVDTDGTVYVGTHNAGNGDTEAPSRVFAYAPDGTLLREHAIEGQGEMRGILGMAFDAEGLLYILDRDPARVLTLDPATGEQRDYATMRDVPTCEGEPDGSCSATESDLDVFPDDLAFTADGTLYVTDLEQALIWRIPPGGGEAEVWLTDPRLESVFGPNGLELLPDGRTFLLAQTGSLPPGTADAGTGKIYRVGIAGDGTAGELELFWEGNPVDGPDGFKIARSGNVYVALAGANQVLVLDPDGAELARVPATPLDNLQQEVPFDTPASVAFDGERILVTNQSFFTGAEASWVVFDVFAGEPGLPLVRPSMLQQEQDPSPGDATPPPATEEPGAQDDPPATATAAEGLPATGGGALGLGLVLLAVAVTGRALGSRRSRAGSSGART